MTLLLAMLTTMTSWAQTVTVPELTVTNVTITSAVASWTACDDVSSYTLQLASDYQFTTEGSLIAEYSVTDGTSYTFTGLTPGATYYTRVKGDADWSNVVGLVTSVPNILNCDITMPNQTLEGPNNPFDNISYKFEYANNNCSESYAQEFIKEMGFAVKDGENTLSLGTDYYFGSVTYANGDPITESAIGDQCKLEIVGKGNYAGSKWASFKIIAPDDNGTWGENLTWAFHDGTLTITGTGEMNSAASNNSYSWFSSARYVETITIGEDVTSIAASAFAGTDNVHSYGKLTTLNLPSTVTEIGENAFAYCSSLTIDLDAILAKNITLGNNAFYQIGRLTGLLADNADNATKIELFSKATANVTLQGRTLTKDGKWNTICLPFSMDADQIASSPLAGATIKEMDCSAEGTELNDGTLTLKFNTVYDPTDAPSGSIVAGKPYIVKWDGTSGSVNDPVFSGVTIFSDAPTAVKSYDNKVTFVGQYSPFKIGDVTNGDDGNLNEIIMLGANNELGYSNNARSLKCFRAHFYVKSDGSTQAARAFVLDFDDETTSLSEELRVKSEEFATSAEWYSLDGRKLTGKPTQKGVYIVNGKKIVVK